MSEPDREHAVLDSTRPIQSLRDRRVRALTVGLVATITLVAFESLAVITVLPVVAEDLGGVGLYGWVTSAFFLGTVIGVVLAGAGTDRTGPARPFVVGLALFGAGLVVAALAPSMPVLVGGRALQGLGGGAIPAIAYATIGRTYPEPLRPRVFAVLSSAWLIPGLGGPALSAIVAEQLGWRWVFGGLLPLVLAAGLMTLRSLRSDDRTRSRAGTATATETETETETDQTMPLLPAVRVSAGAGLVLAGLTARSVAGLALILVGVVVGLGPLRRLLPSGTLSARRGVAAAVAVRGLLTFAFFGADTFVPLAVTTVRAQSTTVAGITVSTGTVCWTAGAWTQARLSASRAGRDLITAGLVLVGVGVAGFALVLLPVVPLAVPIACFGVAGFGIGVAYSPIAALMLAASPLERQGAASAAVTLGDNLGTALGAGLGGVAVAASDTLRGTPDAGLTVVFLAAAAVAMLGSGVARRVPVLDRAAPDPTANRLRPADGSGT